MTLSHLYQKPLCLEPLDADPETNGKKSDHRIVISKPISVINNKCARQTRKVKVRHFPQSGILKMKDWFIDQTWEEVYCAESAHEKASIFQKDKKNPEKGWCNRAINLLKYQNDK